MYFMVEGDGLVGHDTDAGQVSGVMDEPRPQQQCTTQECCCTQNADSGYCVCARAKNLWQNQLPIITHSILGGGLQACIGHVGDIPACCPLDA